MKNDVRLSDAATDEEIHISTAGSLFKSLAEEVRARSDKLKNNPTAIPQKLSPSEFNTAMVHFYRGEIQRSNVWRNRLDATTNWAVITTGATLSFVFSSPDNPPFVIPINTILVAIFMFMEARRYRYYEVWASRVRVLETGYFAPMLSHRTIAPDKEWADHLSNNLLSPHFTISIWEAIGRRLRSNYIWIFILLALSWTLKIYIHPYPITSSDPRISSLDIFFQRSAVGLAPGWLVLAVGVAFNGLMIFLSLATMKLRNASSEVLPLDKFEWHPLKQMTDWAESNLKRRNTIRRAKKARNRIRTVQTETSKVPNS
jgi:Predicted integral membrane protein